MTILYPYGYGADMVSLDELRARTHPDKMHPEYARRLFAWIEAQTGRIGIGGSWRPVDGQPDKPGFAPEGKSFHQSQSFPSGSWFAAVDLVARNPGGVHRSPRWDEVPAQGGVEARDWGVHANVSTEPWHMQPVELDGWQSWVNAGRPDLTINYGAEELDMQIVNPPRRILDTRQTGRRPVDGETITVRVPINGKAVFVNLTAATPAKRGYLTAWSGNSTRPDVSNLNYGDTGSICNTSWVPLHNGQFQIFVKSACDVIVDLQAVAQ